MADDNFAPTVRSGHHGDFENCAICGGAPHTWEQCARNSAIMLAHIRSKPRLAPCGRPMAPGEDWCGDQQCDPCEDKPVAISAPCSRCRNTGFDTNIGKSCDCAAGEIFQSHVFGADFVVSKYRNDAQRKLESQLGCREYDIEQMRKQDVEARRNLAALVSLPATSSWIEIHSEMRQRNYVTHLKCVHPTESSAVCMPEDPDEKQASRELDEVTCLACLRIALECDRAIIKMRGVLPDADQLVTMMRAARAEATPQGTFDVPWEYLTPECQENWRIEARALLNLLSKKEK